MLFSAQVSMQPIVIAPFSSPLDDHVRQVTAAEHIESKGGPTSGTSVNDRSQDLHVKWIALEIAMSAVVATSEVTYISECNGQPDASNEAFATNLVAASKAMQNSGTAMVMRGNELLKKIADRKAQAGTQANTDSSAKPDTEAETDVTFVQPSAIATSSNLTSHGPQKSQDVPFVTSVTLDTATQRGAETSPDILVVAAVQPSQGKMSTK